MCQISVDFAKHGKCVEQKTFIDLQKIVNKLSRSKTFAKHEEPILQSLQKEIKLEEVYENYIKLDW